MTKIEKIKELDNKALIKLMKILLDIMGFQSVKEDGIVLRAEEKTALGLTKHAFIVPDLQLSGNVQYSDIADIVKESRDRETFNVVTIVSNQHILAGFQSALNKLMPEVIINYIGRDELISIVDDKYPDFWKHDDTALIEYEHQYEEVMEKENQLKLLHLPSDKYQRLMNIFIQPTLIEEQEVVQTHMLIRKRVEMKE